MKTSLFIFFLLLASIGFSQKVQVAGGEVKRLEKFSSQYVDPRNVDVWLPEGYSPKKKYAVVYMHDGQMLFDSATTWNHQEWGVDETASRLMREGKIKDCIVVGIWNNGQKRWPEYFPQKAFDYLSAEEKARLEKASAANNQTAFALLADQYLLFLVKELKPFIDNAYSTKKDKNHTFIMGSSMGGLISMYAICEYPKVFGAAACVSTHWPGAGSFANNPLPAAFQAYLKDHLPTPRKNRLYFDYGDQTLDALYPPLQAQVDEIMKTKGFSSANWTTKGFPGEDHSERSWAKRLEIPMLFLLKAK
ncbi:MAG: esterase family protein [Haliscomenobacter sp.]|nr:esterase family protein [Haliscomenobacter sp.]